MSLVLLLEDDRISAHLAAKALHRMGHQVVTAASVEEGWMTLCQHVFADILFLDIQLGTESGNGLLQKIRPHFLFAKLPVVVCTATPTRSLIQEYLSLGIQNFLAKPYDPKRMAQEIQKVAAHPWHSGSLESISAFCTRTGLSREDFFETRAEGHIALLEYEKKLRGCTSSADIRNIMTLMKGTAGSIGFPMLENVCHLILQATSSQDTAPEEMLEMLPHLISLVQPEETEGEAAEEPPAPEKVSSEGHESSVGEPV